MAGFFRNLEVLNPGIKSVKNIWNLKQVWITPKSLSHFSCYLSGVYKNVFMRNDISNIILQEISVFFDMMLSFNQVIFWVFVSIRNCFMCFFSVLDVMNIFESLVVLNIEKLN